MKFSWAKNVRLQTRANAAPLRRPHVDWTRQIYLAARSAGKPAVRNDPARRVDLVVRAQNIGFVKPGLRALEEWLWLNRL